MNYADMHIYYGTKCKLFYEAYRRFHARHNDKVLGNPESFPTNGHLETNAKVLLYMVVPPFQTTKFLKLNSTGICDM